MSFTTVEWENNRKMGMICMCTWNIWDTYSRNKLQNLTTILFLNNSESLKKKFGRLVIKDSKGALMEFRPISERICYIRIKMKSKKLSNINL